MDRAGHDDVGALEFWREYLADAPAVLELPTDHRRPGRPGHREGRHAFALGAGLTTGLRRLSQAEQVPLPMTLMAAVQALLYRYTGQEDLLVGLAAPGHTQAHRQRAAGGFAGPVVLRADLAGQPSVRELLRRTRAAGAATARHAQVSFGAVVAQVRPEQGPGRHPLVQVLLAVAPRDRPAGWELAPAVAAAARGLDLCMAVSEQADELTGWISYNRDLFEPGTVERIAGHWQAVLAGMVAGPERLVADLELVGEQEAQRLRAWGTGREVSAGPGLRQLIGQQARTRPDTVAVVCEQERLTYRELDSRAGRLASYLRGRGVASGAPVGVCLQRSCDHVIALVAILKAGGAYVPLDPEAPAARVRYMMQDAQMRLVLAHDRLRHKVDGAGAEVLCLDRGAWAEIGRHGGEEPGQQPRDDQLAYVIYTSGSTGRPKGVMVERGPLAAHCRAVIEEYGLGPADRVLQFSQYSADASVEQILSTLASGGRLIMRGPEIWSPRQLLEQLIEHRVTVMNLSPAHWYQTVREWAGAPHELAGLRLRLVILGGERVAAHAVRQWRGLGLPGVRLLNAYGPTEATITATLGEAGEEEDPITIGRPLAGRTVHILDHAGRPVPAGVVGEVHIGGGLLARGYLNRPGLTSERFVPDPFAARPGARLYRTGDLARFLPDGRIDYMGRADHQVKVRGYRIELGEVEAALEQHPAVGEAVVVTRGQDEAAELVAYVVARGTAPLAQAELRRYLGGKLPRHMQPGVIVPLEVMPRLATGKPDRRGLPAVDRARQIPYLPPRLAAQRRLAGIWAELLDCKPIGIRDNFFDLGGQSLLAAQLVDRIERAFGTRLPLSALLANPTIEELAEVLGQGQQGGAARARVLPVQASGSRRPFFFLHGDWTGGAFYCFALARACGPEQPFYALATYEFSAQDGVPALEAIAHAHIEAMRGVQEHGPYRLGGFCNGGLLAYEMARQLVAAGEEVEFLALVNPSPPVQFSALRAACERIQAVRGADVRTRADLYLRARHAQRHIYRLLLPGGSRVQDFGQLLAIEPRLKKMFPARQALYKDYVGVLNWAAAAYRPGIYPGRITFYWARDEPGIARTWLPVLRHKDPADCAQHAVAGTHMSSVTDHIDDLARALSEGLSRADQHSAAVLPR